LTDVDAGTANILKQEMLAAGGDAAVAIGTVSCKIEKTDILLMGTVKQYQRALSHLTYNVLNCPKAAEEIKGALGL
jgi:dihydropteroate synthase